MARSPAPAWEHRAGHTDSGLWLHEATREREMGMNATKIMSGHPVATASRSQGQRERDQAAMRRALEEARRQARSELRERRRHRRIGRKAFLLPSAR